MAIVHHVEASVHVNSDGCFSCSTDPAVFRAAAMDSRYIQLLRNAVPVLARDCAVAKASPYVAGETRALTGEQFN